MTSPTTGCSCAGLNVELLAKAMCLANGDTPEQAEKFYEREVEEAAALIEAYAALSCSCEDDPAAETDY